MRGIWAKYSGVLLVILTLCANKVNGTHLRTADILVERFCGTLRFKITITAYLNNQSPTSFGTNSEVRFGDGQMIRIPVIAGVYRPDLGPHVSVATFVTEHTYANEGEYLISYIEHDRSTGVMNILDSDQLAYTSFVRMKVKNGDCNTVPVLTVLPLDHACSGKIFFHNPGSYDVEGDSISYELGIPSGGDNETVLFRFPNHELYYPGFFETGNEAKNGKPTFEIDSLTGLLTWDAPGMIGEYNIAFRIKEWRKRNDGTYELLSTTTRDMQIIVEDCDNDRPDLTVPENVCVTAGTLINETITGNDVNTDTVRLEVFSEIMLLPPERSPATVIPSTPTFVFPPTQLSLQWNTNCLHVRSQPYQVVFKITDRGNGPSLVTYKTWSIHVVGPAPVWKTTTLDVVKHHAVLEWEPYTCANAQKIQIWRRVGPFDFTPDECQTGLPGFAGYTMIAEVGSGVTTFTDTNNATGLAPGAKYCYRLLAVFPDTKSYVSEEMCEGPVEADAPVITHVSVEKTASDGAVRISWRSPLSINHEQFPKPYEYEVYRTTGFTPKEEHVLVSGRVRDTTYLDEGINTAQSIFNYHVVIYAKPQLSDQYIAVDTSSNAATVRLGSLALEKSIELFWQDSVPWSNVVQQRPYHLIYRAPGLATEEELILIDSVDVTEEGFHYLDNNATDPNQSFTYRIQTRGSYGNPSIALQKNFSQLHQAYPANNLLPCAPTVSIQMTDCSAYIEQENCGQADFSNTLTWTPVFTPQCRSDISSYNVYASDVTTGEFTLIASGIQNTNFVESGLFSFARCYRVSAVDGQGHEGTLSEIVCNENCPYYELPNVFTPNGDGCNDVFTARYNMDNEGSLCPSVEPAHCPRFVDAVTFTVLNRWGREVYHFTSADSEGIYIDWNGKDSNNDDLGAGVYYFVADVTFNMANPANRQKKIKGWVHLFR